MLNEEHDDIGEKESEEGAVILDDEILIDDGVNLGGDDLGLEEEGYGMSYSMPRGLDE